MIAGTCGQMAYQSNVTRNTLGGQGSEIKGHTNFSSEASCLGGGQAKC